MEFETRLEQEVQRYLSFPIVAEALELLKKELPRDLVFHSADHTRDVICEVLRFALEDDLGANEVTLLVVAAAYHDVGFTKQLSDNETIGARHARKAMQKAGGYSEEQIRIVETMINDTRMLHGVNGPHRSISIALSRYLLDADLSNLGRPDFFEKLEAVVTESLQPRAEVLQRMEKQLTTHEWWTAAAKRLRTEGLQKNLASLRSIIQTAQTQGAGEG